MLKLTSYSVALAALIACSHVSTAADQKVGSGNLETLSTGTTGALSRRQDEYLVGVYYFAGWWKDLPNKWNVEGKDWRVDWPQRVPLLGEYNDQATMDREIATAAEHGVDFFQILYYCQTPGSPPEPNAQYLNLALDQFMASPNASRMKFVIEPVNHPPYDAPKADDWERCCKIWAQAMKHPSYLRIDGRPVFKIHGYQFLLNHAQGNPELAKARLDVLRKAVRDAGAGELLLSTGILPEQIITGPLADEFDFFTTYMWMPQLPQTPEPYPYSRLIDFAEAGWKNQNDNSKKFYVPYVPAGWDPRPWKDPRCSFEMPTRQQWTDALRRARRALDDSQHLGVPTRNGRQKMLLIYAWNEFGEGGIVAPTKGDQTMKLEAIRDVFSNK